MKNKFKQKTFVESDLKSLDEKVTKFLNSEVDTYIVHVELTLLNDKKVAETIVYVL